MKSILAFVVCSSISWAGWLDTNCMVKEGSGAYSPGPTTIICIVWHPPYWLLVGVYYVVHGSA